MHELKPLPATLTALTVELAAAFPPQGEKRYGRVIEGAIEF